MCHFCYYFLAKYIICTQLNFCVEKTFLRENDKGFLEKKI